ncbi:MAG TPA: ABC transporter substrate-binding protein, partial [Acidimicrobiales bacterium]|nr:ABC transporter substrate-binding protein [Acidimicrobiales bacterium]
EYSQMHANYPSQTYVNSLPDTSFFFLNTRVAPFSSLAARRAVNYALDRRALTSVEAIDDFSGGGKITCQVLPPDFPSYERYCPYTLDPGGGNWTAPDLVTAKTLVAQSGMKGTRVTVVDTPFFGNEKQSMILVRTLNELGFVARLREIPANKYFPEVANSKNGIQAGFFNWQSDYIAASNFFEPLLACNSFQPSSSSNLNASELCDRSIDREIARAAEAQLSNSGASVADWTKVDHEVVDEAPWVPVANPQTIDFVSRRVGNYQFNPQFGELADLLWVQ